MYTLIYKDANWDTHCWIFRSHALAEAMRDRIIQRDFHHWSGNDVQAEDDPASFIHTEEYATAREDWHDFTDTEEWFEIRRIMSVNCLSGVEALALPVQ